MFRSLLLGLAILVIPLHAAENPFQPRGIFVCRGPNPTPESEVNFPFVSGWLVRPAWNLVEPQDGTFDWTYIDNEIALARKLNKKITLSVLGGPQTPDWVYSAGAQPFTYSMPRGPIREGKIPVLWDTVYLRKWTALVRALGQRYSQNETVILVHMTGATANGLEMQLPFAPPDRDHWQSIGYSPAKVVAAWSQIIDAYAAAFPARPLDIDIHPILDSNDIPRDVAAYASKKLGARFGIFGGWLSGKSAQDDPHHAAMHDIAARYGPRGFAAFQMIGNVTRTPARLAPGGLDTAIRQALPWNARYFEVWEIDAKNPALHPLLQSWSTRLQSEN